MTGGDLVDPTRIARLDRSFAALIEKMRGAEPERAEGALAARGMADAAAILARRFTLQATNVPYLGRGRQEAALAAYLKARFDNAKADLATAMVTRMRALVAPGGTVASVTPQNWLFLGSYGKMREALLARASLAFVIVLGEHGFDSPSAAGAFTALVALSDMPPDASTVFDGLDASDAPDPSAKAAVLRDGEVRVLGHSAQAKNPDFRISVQSRSGLPLLSAHASAYQGITSGDNERFRLFLWETVRIADGWELLQSSVDETVPYAGCETIIWWGRHGDHIARPQGMAAWGRLGLGVSQMRSLPVTLTTGSKFDMNVSTIVPVDEAQLPAIWAFCSSPDYAAAVRRIDWKLNVTNATLVKVPFDLAYWQKIAAEKYPDGLPEPYCGDPTQWLFHGHPRYAESGTELHVALARLAGYRWPAESNTAIRLSAEALARIAEAATLPEADADGLLALVPVLGERPLADRLRAYCAAAWGDAWRPSSEAALIAAACERAKDKPPKQLTFDAWLRSYAARQHAKLFQDRPFLWWITDGRPDGFAVVANYHRLDRANLERVAYSMLNDWIDRQGNHPRAEAARILQNKLARILEGEKPYDIFVRWKPLDRQPLGWQPDLDDGVRQNVRPFITAGVLGCALDKILKAVDRGKDVPSAPWYHLFHGERRNDHHTTLADRRAARAQAAE
jgi:hypothetical protein